MLRLIFVVFWVVCLRQYARGADCNCEQNFSYLVKKVTENYPGFSDKVTGSNQAAFRHFTDSLMKRAAGASEEDCHGIMNAWLSFFRDKHIVLVLNNTREQTAFIRRVFSNEETIPFRADSLKKYFDHIPVNSLEGEWRTVDGTYEVAIIKHNNRLAGIILHADSVFWMPGQVKFELLNTGGDQYRLIYKTQEHDRDTSDVTIDTGQQALVLNSVRWTKTYPHAKSAEEEEDFYFRLLNKGTCLLRLSSFDLPYKKKIDSLITANLQVITGAPNLIIDVRGNRGGFNLAFDTLLTFLYTNPIIAEGSNILATEDNIKLYESLLSNKEIPASEKEKITGIIHRLKMSRNGYSVEKDDTLRLNKVYKYPEKVAVIVDGNCASATEHLVLKAKQSTKVTVFGATTAGIIDYINLIGPREFSCSHYVFYCPTAKSNRLPGYPLDNIGIPPDVRIDKTVKNWVSFVNEYMNKP